MLYSLFALALQSQVAPPAKPAPDPNKKVCRKVEVIGSNVPNLECRTAAEWKAIDGRRMNGDDAAQLQRMQNQGQTFDPHH